MDGYVVTAIAFDSKGNAWIGTQTQGLIRYNEKETVFYNSSNLVLSEDFFIWDIVVDKNDNVWIGVDYGLLKYDGKVFTLYNSQNTAMPEDMVRTIRVDSKNNIWFASCRSWTGGLVKYDGTHWTTYTPDNSPLPTNLILGMAIDQSDNVWLLSENNSISPAYLTKISNDNWIVYDVEKLGFTPYMLGGIHCDSKNRLWGMTGRPGGTMYSAPPHFFIFDGEKSTLLSCNDNISFGFSSKVTIDHNDYVWCSGIYSGCGVWIDNQWMQFDRSVFGGSSAWVIKEDSNHRIWFGTGNGIYIK